MTLFTSLPISLTRLGADPATDPTNPVEAPTSDPTTPAADFTVPVAALVTFCTVDVLLVLDFS
jgi:hypothetical protein